MLVHRSLLRSTVYVLTAVACGLGLHSPNARAEDPAIRIATPVPFQVIQRVGFDPNMATTAAPRSAAYGAAEIIVSGTLPEETTRPHLLQYRVVRADDVESTVVDWAAVILGPTELKEREFRFTVTVPAGGWYRLEEIGRAHV